MPRRNLNGGAIPGMDLPRETTPRRGGNRLVRWILVLTSCITLNSFALMNGILFLPAVGVAGEDAAGSLYFVWWRAAFWGEQAAGAACWLQGSQGNLRCEVGRNSDKIGEIDSALETLLRQRGEGWTFTAVGSHAGTYQAWGERWQEADYRLLQWGRVLTTALVQPHMDWTWLDSVAARKLSTVLRLPPRPRWLRSDSHHDHQRSDLRLEITMVPPPPAQTDTDPHATSRLPYRQQLEQRGRGRGAAAEIVDFRWQPMPDSGGLRWIQVTSSRRPGKLEITVPLENIVTYPVPEAFLPLWTLGELLGAVGSPGPGQER